MFPDVRTIAISTILDARGGEPGVQRGMIPGRRCVDTPKDLRDCRDRAERNCVYIHPISRPLQCMLRELGTEVPDPLLEEIVHLAGSCQCRREGTVDALLPSRLARQERVAPIGWHTLSMMGPQYGAGAPKEAFFVFGSETAAGGVSMKITAL
jgi:hypothetical protein